MARTWLTFDKEHQKACQRKWQAANKDRVRNKSLLRRFGITLAQYNAMLEKQSGVCAICQKSEKVIDKRSGKTNFLSVDHCHKTGKVRGLLCKECNTGIGKLKDDADLIMKAAKYLKDQK